jgi:hypothetical protein
MVSFFRSARRQESRCRLILAYALRDTVSPEIDAETEFGVRVRSPQGLC